MDHRASAAAQCARVDSHSEVRLVTCLFVDVVGSTDATLRLGPERMKRRLDEAFAEMSQVIVGQGGTVEKYIGDAIFALFGAPTTRADDAERALRAGEACARSAAIATGGLAVRIGIETGEALVDLSGLEDRQRMVVGTCVNIAARLQQTAEPGQILVGPTCRSATAAVAAFDPLGSIELRGVGTVDAWRFDGFREEGSPEIEFIGRSSELAALATVFRRAADGPATLAVVLGPPGQGKSRLVAEAIRRSGIRRVTHLRCRPGTEVGLNTPLRQLLDADIPGATPEVVRLRLSSLLGDVGPEVASALNHAAGLASDPAILALGAYEQRELIADAWRRYLERLAKEEMRAIVAEDVHWADPLLLRVIDHVTAEANAPLVVLATARPEFAGSAGLRPRHDRLALELGPLEPEEVARLVALAGDGEADRDIALERSGGNPLFVIELARAHPSTDDVPVTLQAAIAARLDELPSADRALLQTASVVGETFDVRDASLLGGRLPAEVAAALGQMAHLGFVTPVASGYRFHHALVHDVAYGRLPLAERLALHARYAVDGLDPDDLEGRVHHWWRAVGSPDAEWVWEDRLPAMRREAHRVHMAAGQRLEQRNAYEKARDIFLRAVELADDVADRAAAEAAAGWGFARSGMGDDAWSHRLTAIELYGQTSDGPPARLYADMLEIATFNWGYFHHLPADEEVNRLLEEGLRVARMTGDQVSLARLLAQRAAFRLDARGTEEVAELVRSREPIPFAEAAQRMATVYIWSGRVADAVSMFETVFERLIPAGALVNEPEGLAWYGMAAFTAGDLERADALADQLQEVAIGRSVHTRSHSYSLKALVQFGTGDSGGMLRTIADLRALADTHPDASMCLLSAAALGYGAASSMLTGGALPPDLDEQARRHVDDSERVQEASVMLPKVMAGDVAALARGLRGYEPGLRLWDRFRAWDVAGLLPAIALTMLERWGELAPVLHQLDQFERDGGALPGALAEAIREEQAASHGGPPPAHARLRRMGYEGISALVRYRPSPAPG